MWAFLSENAFKIGFFGIMLFTLFVCYEQAIKDFVSDLRNL